MKYLSGVLLAVLLGANFAAYGVAKRGTFDINVSSITCQGTKFSYVATWPDAASSSAYNIKLGNQCKLGVQQCTTNSAQSCTAKCTNGKCQADFNSCLTSGAGSLSVVATNGTMYQEKKYAVPVCK